MLSYPITLGLSLLLMLSLIPGPGSLIKAQEKERRNANSEEQLNQIPSLRHFSIRVVSEDVVNGTVRYVIANRLPRVITAWEVEYRMTYASGRSSSLLHATDWAMAGRWTFDENEGPLRPGEEREVTANPVPPSSRRSDPAGYGELTGIAVDARAIIFEDLGTVGDPARAAEILEERKISQSVREHWLEELKTAVAEAADEQDLLSRLGLIKKQLRDGNSRYPVGRHSSDHSSARLEEKSLAGSLAFPMSGLRTRSGRDAYSQAAQIIKDLEVMVSASRAHVPRDPR
ncbi:MAG TPA: hypothetical protein VLU25_04195 [Acidobacteriota bacterium]|nr:hypothetical protein [Acidobacteriota bacterium]